MWTQLNVLFYLAPLTSSAFAPHSRSCLLCSNVAIHSIINYDNDNEKEHDIASSITDNSLRYASTSSSDEPIISIKGKTANFMLYWPPITTFTLVQGWNDALTIDYKEAVDKTIDKNPILAGKATKEGTLNNIQIKIKPGAFPTNSHEFVNEIDFRKSLPSLANESINLASLNATQILKFMDDNLAPVVPKADSVLESITNGFPLFSIDLIHLPNGYACYVVKMSHCVGDGVTYYNIMDEINHNFNHHKHKKRPIDWSNEAISQHEVYPERFSSRDTQRMYGFPFFLGLLRNFWNIRKQKKGYLLLSKKKIEEKKKELSAVGHGRISSNDIITTALCEANLATDIFAFTMNMRSLHCKFGGNFHNEVPFPKNAVLSKSNDDKNIANPMAFRNILKKGYFYERNQIPLCPSMLGTVGRISSLATIQKLILKDDMKVLCHTMLSSFVANVPMDTAFISSMDDNFFVVLHNFRDMKEESLLTQLSP
mmetsp:Transcript_17356/g.20076  ORF Transcript_17356/g.20076 Transcript_17356/m.20076 type:complete len:483 (-) Transcript_17356:76-1524(-)